MLNTPNATEDRPSDEGTPDTDKTDKRKDIKNDSSAEFIQELAESGSASDLGTVNAAADAVEGKEDQAIHPEKKKRKSDA